MLSGFAGNQLKHLMIWICQKAAFSKKRQKHLIHLKTKAAWAAANPCWGHRWGRGTSSNHHIHHHHYHHIIIIIIIIITLPSSPSSLSIITSSSSSSGRSQTDFRRLYWLSLCFQINDRFRGEQSQLLWWVCQHSTWSETLSKAQRTHGLSVLTIIWKMSIFLATF